MMWRSKGCGGLGLILGILVWRAPISGWAGPPDTAPDEARSREAAEFRDGYERLYGKGRYGEAASLAERACSKLEEYYGDASVEISACLNDLGLLYHVQGAYEKAEPLLERALAIREKALGPDHPNVAESLNSLALLYKYQGAYEKAKPLLERALAIREEILDSDHPLLANSLNDMATLYHAQGAYERAEPLLMRALVIWRKALGPDHPNMALISNNLANVYHDQGAYGKARPLYERALVINEKALGPDHPSVATSIDNLATLYDDQGAYGKAEPLYERALIVRERALGPDHPNMALSLNNLALLYYKLGEYGKAEPLFKRGLAITEKALGPDHPNMALSLNNLAYLYRDQGAYGKAEPLCERALIVWEKALGPDHPRVATSLNTLANLYHEQGAYGRAEPLYERALAINMKALGPEHPTVASGLVNLASLYLNQREYGKAGPLYERAQAIWEKTLSPDHPDIATGLDNLVVLYHDQRKHKSALTLHRRALDIEETNLVRTLTVADEARRLAYASTLSGSLHYALSLHLRVLPEHDSIATLALTTLLRRKNCVQDLITQSNNTLRRSLPQEYRHILDDLSDVGSRITVLSSRGPGNLTVEAFRQQLDDLREEEDRLWSELAKHSALVEALDDPITIEDVQETLSAGSALVEIAQYAPRHDDAGVRVRIHETKPPPRYAAYLVFPDRFDWVDLGPAAPLDEHVKTFRKALQTKQAIPTDLYDAVMRPIVEKLGSTRRLVIAPAGTLSLVPFGALYDGERYLIEKYELRYVTTGRDLLAVPASPPVTTTPMTIVANPTGAFLPDAELEANFLEGFFPDTRVLRSNQATETNVRTVERPLILHMATHGFFGDARNERDNPMFRSGLHLADIEQVEVDRERDDGQLTAYEVSGMDLRGTQLVVLSACDTGMGAEVMAEGKVIMSEGVSGLRRAFAMAGARTTVMSLWAVSGVTAQTTMEAYYRKLAEGLGRGEAMQAVQLEMLRTKEHAHPKDWAVFIVSGDDDPLDFPAGQEPRVVEEEPPETEGRGGCATRRSGRGAPASSMLVGLLGLTGLRRRGR
jgi:CHAT domain-containing protein/tetratricopeptide (TPR) repeat protein